MDELTASQIIEHNKRLHDKPGYAADYDRSCGIIAHPWERRTFERDVDEICSILGTPEGKSVLDVGCGTGSLTLLAMERGLAAVGIDLSHAMLDRLRTKAAERGLSGRLDTEVSTVEDYLASSSRSFDAILFSAVLHHLPDYLDVLRLAAEHTNPGGVLYIIHEPSLGSRTGPLARGLEWLDRALAELPGFLRRQWGDVRRHGFFASLVGKVRRRLGRPVPRHGPAQPPSSPRTEANWALVDYHAKHGGCDELAIAKALSERGFHVDLRRYDSKRHRVFHWLAQVLRTQRMIRIIASRAR